MNERAPVSDAERRRNRRNILLIAAIALVPAILAYGFLFLFPGLIPHSTTNRGTLVRPPIPITQISSQIQVPRGKWLLVVADGTDCDEACNHALYLARQVNIALGKDAGRLERLLLVSGNSLSPEFHDLLQREYPRVQVQYLAPGSVDAVLGKFDTHGHIFMVDPRGFIMMEYTATNSGKDILDDLKHLLGIGG